MVDSINKAKWERCVEFCRSRLSDLQFKTWITPVSFCSFDAHKQKLLVGVPSHYFYEYLEDHFAELLHQAIVGEFGPNARLFYRILTDKTNRLTQEVAGAATSQPSVLRSAMQTDESQTEKIAAAPKKQNAESNLLVEYSFENFIEGESNILPRSVGMSIAENPQQTTFNPLFIYGHSGVGKTHLVNAIGLRLKENFPEKRVLYVSANLFHTQFVDSNLKNKVHDFIRFYQQIDVLIIDDIQEFVGMPKTQNTFFQIFNHLKQNGKQIILTCDRPPVELQGMEERLITRFKWGLQAEIGQPNEKLRHDILENNIARNGLKIPMNVIDYISENVTESVRELEGVVTSLMAYSVVFNRNIDITLARQIVTNVTRIENKPITVEEIIDQTCAYCKVNKAEIYTATRKANVVEVRQISMYLAHKYTQLSTSKIGALVGNRNHTTVIHSIRIVQDQMKQNAKYKQKVEEIEKNVKTHKAIDKHS